MKTKRRRKQAAAAGNIHARDGRPGDLAQRVGLAIAVVDDPHATSPGEKVTVLRQLRNDPLARLHSRRQIDEAQYRAGRAFQRDWEIAERAIRAVDPARERVDGGRSVESLTEKQVRARRRLIALEHVLGRTMYRVVHAVLVDGLGMEVVAKALFAREGEAVAKYYGRLFRDALDLLAVEYGLTGTAQRCSD